MSKQVEMMNEFELNEKPCDQTGCEWTTDGASVYFLNGGVMYQEVFGSFGFQKNNMSLCFVDVQQFMSWQPMVFTTSMQINFDEFEYKYGELM